MAARGKIIKLYKYMIFRKPSFISLVVAKKLNKIIHGTAKKPRKYIAIFVIDVSISLTRNHRNMPVTSSMARSLFIVF